MYTHRVLASLPNGTIYVSKGPAVSKFSTWTTQTAFSMTLTRVGIGNLLACNIMHDQDKSHPILRRQDANYLLRRGLIEDTEQEDCYRPTRAGQLTSLLLIEAGFTYESFNLSATAERIVLDHGGIFVCEPIEESGDPEDS